MGEIKSAKTSAKKGGEINSSGFSNPKKLFFVFALDMTWQLAIVVLVPIVGGYKLDGVFKTTPTLTIIGFVIAMVGTFLVMKRVVDRANDVQTKNLEVKKDGK